MLKEMIEKIQSLAHPQTFDIEELTYADRELIPVRPPVITSVKVHTLTGLVDLVLSGFEGAKDAPLVLHVENHRNVVLMETESEEWGRRIIYARAELMTEVRPFRFGQFLDPEEFVIGLMAGFVETEPLRQLIAVASNLCADQVVTSEDDGISQRATVKRGVTLKQEVKINPRISLRPFRTFREVEQPSSEFIFRLRAEPGEMPECALFEADGGKWQMDAMQSVKGWLSGQMPAIKVIA